MAGRNGLQRAQCKGNGRSLDVHSGQDATGLDETWRRRRRRRTGTVKIGDGGCCSRMGKGR
jgi:hypothetical protein